MTGIRVNAPLAGVVNPGNQCQGNQKIQFGKVSGGSAFPVLPKPGNLVIRGIQTFLCSAADDIDRVSLPVLSMVTDRVVVVEPTSAAPNARVLVDTPTRAARPTPVSPTSRVVES